MKHDNIEAAASEILDAIGERRGVAYRASCLAVMNLQGIQGLLVSLDDAPNDEDMDLFRSFMACAALNLAMATGHNLDDILKDIEPIRSRFFGLT